MLDRAHVTDALRFWEIGRIPYNLALAALTLIAIAATAGAWRAWVDDAPALIILAVLANVAYCAAYPIDLFIQASDFRDLWRAYRWIVWAAGTLFALMLAAISLFGFGALDGLADPVPTLTQ